MGILRDIGLWLWRLLPANPILVRVVSGGGRRTRHLWARIVYLGVLALVFLLGGGLFLSAGQQSLADLAKKATNTFMWVSVTQLFLMSFVAPVFCAGAITQEKDANTYHILLTTPLSNAQIVLGSLFSRIYFVWALLLSGLPIFCITMIYGGVTTAEILESFGLAACTGLLTGSIAIMISFLKIGTRRTIFAFFAGVAVYLVGVELLGLSSYGQLAAAPAAFPFFDPLRPYRMSWLAPVHPFLALLVVTGQTPAPDPAAVQAAGWPARWLLAYPQYGYVVLTTAASALMVLISLIYVRRGAREGETTWLSQLVERVVPHRAGERRRTPRRVWRNPIAWREAATRASAGGRSFLRLFFILAGIVIGFYLLIVYHAGGFGSGAVGAAAVRAWLTPLVWIELAVILLVVTNTAATTLTREKESLTIELLLSTPLTSRYIIAGMLQGLVRLVIPLIAVPTLTIAAFWLADLLHTGAAMDVMTIEAVFLVPLLMTAFAALAAMVGLHFSLLSRKTVQAVMVSTGIVMGAAGLLTACGLAFRGTNPTIAAVVLPFTPVWGLQSLLDPWAVAEAANAGSRSPVSVGDLIAFRVTRIVFALVAAAVYLAITYALYSSMVRSFDMTVRRQSV
ncbi:MAG: ABC transporter permease subunit [Phycisphaerae bacterium]|nr:ABC transporter permease subunit [Phycisphaerae bacterium]